MKLRRAWRAIVPIAVALILLLLPAPAGLPDHAWHFFAIFAAVILGLMFEPLPGAAVGLIGVTVTALFARYTLYSPAELARPGFNPADAALAWVLSGFSNGTVWLIFAAFMFALGYEKTGLGRRIALVLVKRMGHRTLLLGYGIALTDTILAPVTPSNTARSGGTIYPIIRNLPALYQSQPNDPSARRIGSYIMWVAIATACVTSSLFLTALAPNLLAVELVNKTLHFNLGWTRWFAAVAPAGILLLLAVPLLTYWLYRPEVTASDEVPKWAAEEIKKLGPLSGRELTVAVLVVMALALWVFGASYVNPTTVALIVIALMLVTRVFSWDDMLKDLPAWNTLIWFGTLVTLADGLNRVGFVKWLAELIGHQIVGLSPTLAMLALVAAFFVSHYMFASVTAHATAVLPVMLAIGATVPGLPAEQYALLLCLTLGIMGIISPYGTGPSPVYYGSGYLPSADYWRLGAVFGLIFFAVFMVITVPWLLATG
jgi:L-tartrate/succinate antiporter